MLCQIGVYTLTSLLLHSWRHNSLRRSAAFSLQLYIKHKATPACCRSSSDCSSQVLLCSPTVLTVGKLISIYQTRWIIHVRLAGFSLAKPSFVPQRLAITLSENQFEAPLWTNHNTSVYLQPGQSSGFSASDGEQRDWGMPPTSSSKCSSSLWGLFIVRDKAQQWGKIQIVEHPIVVGCWCQHVRSTCENNSPRTPSFVCIVRVLTCRLRVVGSLYSRCRQVYVAIGHLEALQPDCPVRGVIAWSFEATLLVSIARNFKPEHASCGAVGQNYKN